MAFELTREADIPTLGATFQEYNDPQSGAKHIHLKSDSSENCFMVSFPTIPHEDDGRAHILEHLSLCGSAKYPTRDPFFSMTRRSLATFMNAMTYPDRTVYPFASQDRQDFFNLLDVYLDAAFFPNLDRIDFLQEGWRLSFGEDGKLSYNGVVFNEMKEPMADPGRALWHGLQSALKPQTTYAFESGGDPLSIPQLTHEDLKAFHATHYHPSRATFWSFGDIHPRAVQERINQSVISKFSDKLSRIEPDSAPLPTKPATFDIKLPAHGEKTEFGYHAAWILGDIAKDHEAINDWQIFEQAIGGDSASPLTMALENAGFGRPSGIIGVDAGSRQATFHIGMEGLREDEIPKARTLIHDTIEAIAKNGIPEHRLQSVVRDFELSSLEIRSGRTPHGLSTLLSMVSQELNGGDPLRAVDVAADLAKASEDVKNPDFVKSMARTLLDSSAKIEASARPDPDFLPSREAAEARALEQALKDMTPEKEAAIRADSEALLARQRAKPDVACLPKIHPSEISRDLPVSLEVEFQAGAGTPSRAFVEAKTNGVGYFALAIDASRMEISDLPWLSLGSRLAMDLGFGTFDYEQAELYRAERGSGFGAHFEAANASKASGSSMALRLRYSAKSLEREAGTMAEALCSTLSAPRFDESERIAFLVQSAYQETLQNISQSGASLASNASSSAFGALGAVSAATGGLESLRFMERVDALSRTAEGQSEIRSKLEEVFHRLADAPCVAIYQGSREAAEQAFASAEIALPGRKGMPSMQAIERPAAPPSAPEINVVALHGPGQLNYCHATWAAPESPHPDCGPMLVLGALLRNTFLHRAVREEGGAYGGSASHSPGMGTFSMSSYRDPRLTGTYADFDAAIASAIDTPVAQEDLEEAIVSIMQSLDKPGTPREKAGSAIARAFAGTREEDRLALRHSVLDCTIEDLRRVAKTHLLGKTPNKAAYVCPKSSAEADASGMGHIEVTPQGSKTPKP